MREKNYILHTEHRLGPQEIFTKYGISLNTGTLNQDFTACGSLCFYYGTFLNHYNTATT
jgi:hypothetical protein